jgi:hypothetical protein
MGYLAQARRFCDDRGNVAAVVAEYRNHGGAERRKFAICGLLDAIQGMTAPRPNLTGRLRR